MFHFRCFAAGLLLAGSIQDSSAELLAVADADVHSIGVSLASEGVPGSVDTLLKTGGLADIGITGEATAVAVDSGIGHDRLTTLGNITSSATADADQESINVGIAVFDFKLPTPGIVIGGAGTEAIADASGIILGDGHNELLNFGFLDVDATVDSSATTVSLNLAEFSMDFLPSVPGVPLGLSAVGAGIGIGYIGAAAGEGIARQPEAIDNIRGNSLIFAALVEGVALFGLVIGLLLSFSVFFTPVAA